MLDAKWIKYSFRLSQRCRLIKNVDILFRTHDAFLEYPSSGTLRVKRLESQIILEVLVAGIPEGLNIIPKISHGHLCLREENLSFDTNYIILETVNFNNKYIWYTMSVLLHSQLDGWYPRRLIIYQQR